jgi:hypothetical protein
MAKSKEQCLGEMSKTFEVPTVPSHETVSDLIDRTYLADALKRRASEIDVRSYCATKFKERYGDAQSKAVRSLKEIGDLTRELEKTQTKATQDRDALTVSTDTSEMPTVEKISVVFAILAALVTFVVSATVVHTTLLATQPETLDGLGKWGFYCFPLLGPMAIEFIALAIRPAWQKRFTMSVYVLGLVGWLLFLLLWSLQAAEAGKTAKDIVEDGFGGRGADLRTALAPYQLVIQLAGEGIFIAACVLFMSSTVRRYSTAARAKLVKLEDGIASGTSMIAAYGDLQRQLTGYSENMATRLTALGDDIWDRVRQGDTVITGKFGNMRKGSTS